MEKIFLFTSFDIWLSHHQSNSSDDLLIKLYQSNLSPAFTFLRKLPVDSHRASQMVIATIAQLRPEIIICCGMAETRTKLSLESQATSDRDILTTRLNLADLVQNLSHTEISHDAGKFVCESLYYQVLKYLQEKDLPSFCIFVHVPRLNEENLSPILADFITIIHRLENL